MKKLFCLMIAMALIVGGCSAESHSIKSADMELHMEGKNYNGTDADNIIEVGGALDVQATVEQGQIEININGKSYTFDKTQETSINLPPGKYDVSFAGHDDFTGEVTLRTLPKV